MLSFYQALQLYGVLWGQNLFLSILSIVLDPISKLTIKIEGHTLHLEPTRDPGCIVHQHEKAP